MQTVVSIPDSLFESADRLAQRRRVSRSAIYSEALELLLSREVSDNEVTRRLDAVYAGHHGELDPSIIAANTALRDDW